ncbi:MAG: biotin/lipoyl-binding protein [Methylocystaceae bacterium]|nr:biotin/lipoyl-binding protein [Methylocystaceae bacterium]
MSELPQLREELEFHAGTPSENGHPTWLISDPVRNKFFQIDQKTFEVLSRWHMGSALKIAQSVSHATVYNISEEFVTLVIEFLSQHQLIKITTAEGRAKLFRIKNGMKQSFFMWLIHHYLFFRIPLIRPNAFLDKTMRFVEPLYSSTVLYGLIACLTIGLFMLNQQWDIFRTSFNDMFSLKGFVYFFIALSLSKIGHELGHAYTAKRYGCRIPTMGVAFLVMWPMLYTDTNETWKLRSLKERRNVALAGMTVELSLAILATLAWSFMGSGALRDMMLVLATTTWISSLLINISPFMRFDGYYLLSDWLNVPNLHNRSFALTRWWLREVLFDLKHPKPEAFNQTKTIFLIGFGFFVWIYRLLLFLGIAVLVYHFFIKAVGIILFLVEIVYFVGKPIWSELRIWLALKNKIVSTRRSLYTGLAFICLLAFCVIPWSTTVVAPALFEAQDHVTIYTKQEGRLVSINKKEGDLVQVGDVLFRFENPDLTLKLKSLKAKRQNLDYAKNAAFYSEDFRQQNDTTFAEIAKVDAEIDILKEQQESLNIIAKQNGVFSDLEKGLSLGQWVGPDQRLAATFNQDKAQIIAYIQEEDIERVKQKANCQFYSNEPDLFKTEKCQIDFIEHVASPILNEHALASPYGGMLKVREAEGLLYPEKAVYKAHLSINGEDKLPERQVVGSVNIDAESKSLAFSLWYLMSVVLNKEMTW